MSSSTFNIENWTLKKKEISNCVIFLSLVFLYCFFHLKMTIIGKPVSWIMIAPSITPRKSLGGSSNPAMRLYKFETDTGQVCTFRFTLKRIPVEKICPIAIGWVKRFNAGRCKVMKKDLTPTDVLWKKEGKKIVMYWLFQEFIHRFPSDRSQYNMKRLSKSDALSSCVSFWTFINHEWETENLSQSLSLSSSWVPHLSHVRCFKQNNFCQFKNLHVYVCHLKKFSLLNQHEINISTLIYNISFTQILISCQMIRNQKSFQLYIVTLHIQNSSTAHDDLLYM